MISKYVKGTHLDKMCFWPMNRLAKGRKTTRESFCYPKKMIKAEPCLTRYPRNEMGAHPFTLQTLRHGINGILHSPKCSKMLQSVSKQNFKKGCCHLCGDRPCFSCGRSNIEFSFGNARRCPLLNCCVQNFYAKFFWCMLTWQGQVTHCAATASSHSDREKPMLLATCITFSPSQYHQQQQYESWCSSSPTVTWNRAMDLSIFATSFLLFFGLAMSGTASNFAKPEYQTVVSQRKRPRGPVPRRAKAIKHVLKLFTSPSVLGSDAGSVWYMEHQ